MDSLTSIFGIGRNLSETILKDANVDKFKKSKRCYWRRVCKIRKELDKYTLEGDLRREVALNIKNKMEIGSYQGISHKKVYQLEVKILELMQNS